MSPAEQYWEIRLRSWGWRAAVAILSLAAAGALLLHAGRQARAEWLAARDDAAGIERAIALDPGNSQLHRRAGRLALLAFDLPRAERAYQATLEHQPLDAKAWMEYAFVLEAEGQPERAAAAVARSLDLAPSSLTVLQGAGNFFLRRGQWPAAARCFRRVLDGDPRAATGVLEACWESAPAPSEILTRVLPERSDAYEAYLRFRVNHGQWEEAGQVWEFARRRGQPPGREAALAYINALVAARRVEEARRAWQDLLPLGDPGNLIYNSSFDRPLLNAGFDWSYRPAAGVELAYDRTEQPGALALRFTGSENPDYQHLAQFVPVSASTGYRCEFALRAEGITSTSGPRVEVREAYSGQLLAGSGAVLGSASWRKESIEFVTQKDTELISVGVRRPAAPNWDQPIAGILWLREFSMRPLGTASRTPSLAQLTPQR